MKTKIITIILIVTSLIIVSSTIFAQTIPSDSTKSLIVDLKLSSNNLTLLSGDVVYGHSPDRKIEHTGIIIRLVSHDNAQLKEYNIRDPRVSFEEDRAIVFNEIDFIFALPFFINLKTINFFEQDTNIFIGSVDISDTIKSFCQNNINDPDCIKEAVSRPVLSFKLTPRTFNLDSNGVLTGHIKVISGNKNKINQNTWKLNEVSPTKVNTEDIGWALKFERQSFVNLTIGEAIEMKLSVKLNDNSSIDLSDTVRTIKNTNNSNNGTITVPNNNQNNPQGNINNKGGKKIR